MVSRAEQHCYWNLDLANVFDFLYNLESLVKLYYYYWKIKEKVDSIVVCSLKYLSVLENIQSLFDYYFPFHYDGEIADTILGFFRSSEMLKGQ